jgi:hypothetical protein
MQTDPLDRPAVRWAVLIFGVVLPVLLMAALLYNLISN